MLILNSFKSPFCEKDGSDIGDDMKVEIYLALLGIQLSEASQLDVYFKSKKLFTKVNQATQDFIKQKLDLAFQVHSCPSFPTSSEAVCTDFLTGTSGSNQEKPRAPHFLFWSKCLEGSARKSKVCRETGNERYKYCQVRLHLRSSHAADLTEREWSVIIRANCLLSGHHVVRDADNNPSRIERSAYNGQ